MSVKTTNQEIEYPWGKVPINSHGYPDQEFEFDSKPRIGYFGDSVNFGVGAGYGHRISEYLEEAYPSYQHWNFGRIGEALSTFAIKSNLKLSKEFKLSKLIYLFNLNDIIPDVTTDSESATNIVKYKSFVVEYLDWLRGKSYLYTYLRTKIKNYMTVKGYESSGYIASELFPSRNEEVVKATAGRINILNERLKEIGVSTDIIILPYEMQVSNEAAKTYQSLQITWEDGFLEGSTQKMLKKYIHPDVNVFDAYYAFVAKGDEEKSKAEIHVGEYFVYNRGDKMDWNHPTKEGHKKISQYLIKNKILE